MSHATRAVVTAVGAALVAVVAPLGELALALLAGVLVLLVAAGWPALVGAPARRGVGVLIALGGLGCLAAGATATDEPYLRAVPAVLALTVLLAFVHELVRRDGRERLVESVAGSVSGAAVAAAAVGWVVAARADGGTVAGTVSGTVSGTASGTAGGTGVVVIGAVALAVASAVSGGLGPGRLGAALTVLVAGAAGAGAGLALPEVGPSPGVVLGVAVGALVATLRRLFDRLPSMRGRWPSLAGAVLPVVVTGILVHVVGRLLVR